MQAAGNSMKIVLYHDYSEFGKAIESALNQKCPPRDLFDDGNRLYQQYFLKSDKCELTIDVKMSSENFHYSLLPKENENPDILFVFSRCAALNKNYKVGDLVIVDQPHFPLNRMLQPSKLNLEDLSKSLPELPAMNDFDLPAFLAFISDGTKNGGQIKAHFKLKSGKWDKAFDEIIGPTEKKYWITDDKYYFKLTEEGLTELKKQPQHEDEKKPRNPTIHLGTSHCSGGMITSFSESAAGKNVDIIEQLSQSVFQYKSRKQELEIVNVCAVQCKEGGDLEARSSVTEAVGNIFLDFMVKIAELRVSSN